MEDSKALLEKIELEERQLTEEANKIRQRKDKVYQDMSIEVIKKVFKVRDELQKPFKTFVEANGLLKELSEVYPGYLGFLHKSDNWETGFDPEQVRFVTDYLLSGKWSPAAEFWRVMIQIGEYIGTPTNPFRTIGGEDG